MPGTPEGPRGPRPRRHPRNANPGAFNDVTVGSDKVGRGGDSLPYGYDCAKGWDPVTGLGTPKYAELLAAAGPP